MNSIILNAATRLLVALMIVFSIHMLLRGHNEPGGGFIAGLIASIGFGLYAVAHGTDAARNALRVEPQTLIVIGVFLAGFAGLAAALFGDPFLTGQWLFLSGAEQQVATTSADSAKGKGLPLSTVLVFDIGVYVVVIGAVLTLVFALEDEA